MRGAPVSYTLQDQEDVRPGTMLVLLTTSRQPFQYK